MRVLFNGVGSRSVRFWQVLMGLAAAAAAASCGFHLRGTERLDELPASSLYIAPSPDYQLNVFLTQFIQKQTRFKLLDAPSENGLYIDNIQQNRSKTVRAVDTNALVKEYQLNYSLHYRYTYGSAPGVERTITLSSTISYSDNQTLSKEREEETLYQTMQRESLLRMVKQLTKLPALKPEDRQEGFLKPPAETR